MENILEIGIDKALKDMLQLGSLEKKQPFFLVGDNKAVLSLMDDLRKDMWEKEENPMNINFLVVPGYRSHAGNEEAMDRTMKRVMLELSEGFETLVVIFTYFNTAKEKFKNQATEMAVNRTLNGFPIPENVAVILTDDSGNGKDTGIPIPVRNKIMYMNI